MYLYTQGHVKRRESQTEHISKPGLETEKTWVRGVGRRVRRSEEEGGEEEWEGTGREGKGEKVEEK